MLIRGVGPVPAVFGSDSDADSHGEAAGPTPSGGSASSGSSLTSTNTVAPARWASSRPQPCAASARPHGEPSATCTLGGKPCSAANPMTRSSASATGMPGSPTTSAELARPVNPPAARSRHCPSGRDTSGGQASAHTRSSRATAAQDGRLGTGGGISRTAVTACRSTRTTPRRVCTSTASGPSSASSPTASVSIPCPWGPRSRWRSATRRPTSALSWSASLGVCTPRWCPMV
jgi:hypothetical protein